MSEFYADPEVGGDASRTTDDDNPTTGLANGGFWTRLVPMFRNVVAIANYVRTRSANVDQWSQIASNAADTAVAAANTATAKVAFIDTATVVQGATDASKKLRISLERLPNNLEVVMMAPAGSGVIATEGWVDLRIDALDSTQQQRQKRHATALSF